MSNTYTLLLTTLNEIEGMKAIYPKIDKSLFDKIIVLDGGSTDGTIQYAIDNNIDYYIQKQKGFRHAYFEILPRIDTSHIITFSPDGNSIPELLQPLIEKTNEGYEMVIVSRYKDNAKSYDDDLITGFGNWLFRFLINILYKSKLTDPMVIYRSYEKNLISKLDLTNEKFYSFPEKLLNTKISWEPLMSIRSGKYNIKRAEIPGDEPERIGGERKLKIIKWGFSYMYQVFSNLFYK